MVPVMPLNFNSGYFAAAMLLLVFSEYRRKREYVEDD